ncbi:hypothetical protein M9H77_30183 [Catharanthus roseus]|uniref:Uncharacterized protein n=1 Tax=Catharanthus roseus TaxID=4058 RepID=A0ACC0A0F4_CATRO|nr:hypothetical protein M9H77_30183 [Catharanthus roseus]
MEGLEQQLSYLAKDMGHLKREEASSNKLVEETSVDIECIIINGHMEGNRFRTRHDYNDRSYKKTPRNKVINGWNYVKREERFHKGRGNIEIFHNGYDYYEHSYGGKNMYDEQNDSYIYRGYNYKRSSQTLGTTSRPLSYNNLKLPLLWGNFGPYDYEA